MQELTQKDLERFLAATTGTSQAFEMFENVGSYGTKESLFTNLRNKLQICMQYLDADMDALIEGVKEYNAKKPDQNFEEVNKVFYQDKLHPIISTIFYAIAEPFLLRSTVKKEVLYLAFKLEKIKKMFIGGAGCGEVIDNLSRLLIKVPDDLSIKGVDISQPGIEFLNYRSKEFKFKTQFEKADLDNYVMNDSYDLSELSEVLEHVRDPQALLTKVGKASKLTFVTIPVMLNVAEHLHLFDLKKIIQMIQAADLDLVYYSVRNSFYVKQQFFFGLLRQV